MPGKHKNRKSYRDPDRPRGQRLSERERTQVLTLYQLAGWNKSQIARQSRLPHSTVRLVIQEGNHTPRKPPGRPFMLTIRRRHRLIKRATQDGFHRRLPLEYIAKLEGIQACRRTLFKAFAQENYHRRVAKEKPLLTEDRRKAQLQWAKEHESWDFNMWKRVLWTDEASFTTGGFGVVYVTRQPGEEYELSCLTPKFRGYSSWMAHGCISGTTKGPLQIFEKKGDKFAAQVYTERILPPVYKHMKEMKHEGGYFRTAFIEDGASVHKQGLLNGFI